MRRIGLTTSDNPYDPIKDFDRWWQFDREHNYATCELLDRVAKLSNRASDDQNLFALEEAIDSICELHPNLYKKVEYTT